ncbi:MAG: DUF928 domain-containing protein [Acaryochloris sp. RU_4_1]|nr:DUF928 domain-containing protein [Acaryochloris sp. SU_5_25]NJM68225.1 DUF928 domain-containing protein [Acaryochloris sp. RU_4_1]
MLTLQSRVRSLTLSLGFAVVSFTGSVQPLLAQEEVATHRPYQQTLFKLPTTTQDPGAPVGRREGGSSRGDKIALCKQATEVLDKRCSTTRLTALVPATPISQGKVQIGGQTMAAHPEFFFFVSQLPNSQSSEAAPLPMEFVLQDETDAYVYRTQFVLPFTRGGIIRLPVPTTSPPLEVDKRYTWTLVTYFKRHERNFVQGTIYRRGLTPQQQQQLQAAKTPLQRFNLFLQAGSWFDAVSTLVVLKQAAPTDLKLQSMWAHLLQDIDLEELAKEPMLSCCTPNSQAFLAPGT